MLERLRDFILGQPDVEEKERSRLEGRSLKFLELTGDELEKLKERIAAHNGLIRIFIHPEYLEYAKSERDRGKTESVEKLKRMYEVFKRILASSSEKAPPIFIFQPLDDISFKQGYESHEEKVKAAPQSQHYDTLHWNYESFNDIFIIPTDAFNPHPLVPEAKTTQEAWEKLRRMIKELGVSKILIAGAEFYVPSKQVLAARGFAQNNVWDHLAGCLGISVSEFRKSFEVELSNLTFPEGRQEIKREPPKIIFI